MTAREKTRARIREVLPEKLEELQSLARAAGYRLPAPDPESGLVYLRQLHHVLEEVLLDLDPRGVARRIARRTA